MHPMDCLHGALQTARQLSFFFVVQILTLFTKTSEIHLSWQNLLDEVHRWSFFF